MQCDKKIENMKKNIKYVMTMHNISNSASLAKKIGVAPTTWHSFTNNLTSNSSAKTAFCNYFGITVHQFEEELLSEIWCESKKDDMDEECSKNNVTIMSLSDEEIYIKFISSINKKNENNSLLELRKQVIKKFNMHFITTIETARSEVKKGNSIDAWNAYNSAWLLLTPDDLPAIMESDFQNYICLCKNIGSKSGLNALTEKLLSAEFYNPKILMSFSILLDDFSELAESCLSILLDK